MWPSNPWPLALLTLLAGSLLFPVPLLAQVAELQGRFLEEKTEAPISTGVLHVLDEEGTLQFRVEADSVGRFAHSLAREGRYRLHASAPGYQTSESELLRVSEGDTLDVDLMLGLRVIPLKPVVVTARSRRNYLSKAVRERMENGHGRYLTRADIERRHATRASDLLLGVPGIRYLSTRGGFDRKIAFSRSLTSGGSRCIAQIFINGMAWNRPDFRGRESPFTLDDAVHPGDVEAIEIYAGLGGIPPEFLSPHAACGVIVVWTRAGP